MSETKEKALVVSPFLQIDSKSSRPAVRLDDKRLLPSQADRLNPHKWSPGGLSPNPGGRPQVKPLSDDLKLRLEQVANAEGKTLAQVLNDALIKGALGEIRLTPSQIGALRLILEYTEGKPGQQNDGESKGPLIVFDIHSMTAK
jgi:hypothetical protein